VCRATTVIAFLNGKQVFLLWIRGRLDPTAPTIGLRGWQHVWGALPERFMPFSDHFINRRR
jgi:hypothetical protein